MQLSHARNLNRCIFGTADGVSANGSKEAVRDVYQSKLASLDFFALIEKSSRLSDHFFSWSAQNATLFQSRYIVSFCPFGNEPQLNIEKEGGGEPYKVSYVRIHDWKSGKMEAHVARRELPGMWEDVPLKNGIKIFHPFESQPICKAEDIAVVLVPGLAFTREGDRLGRGMGFYDRFLSRYPHALRLGIAFEEQVASSLPIDPWDLPIDALLTDGGTIFMKSYGEWQKHGKLRTKG
jgi:5,10-methenyltetrahydrofolate synthetase